MAVSPRRALAVSIAILVSAGLAPACSSSPPAPASGQEGGDGGGNAGASSGSSGGSSGTAPGSSSGAVSSGSGSGSGGGNASSGASHGDAGVSSSGGDGGAGTCLGASLLAALGKSRMLVGVSPTADATAAAAPFDLRYEYISGGLFDSSAPCASCASGCTASGHTCANSSGQGGCVWWGCYQYDMDPPGDYVRSFDASSKGSSPPQIPMFTYYEILQTANGTFTGFQEGKAEATQAATSAPLMTRYFADWRFLLQQIGQDVAIVHIEPDFWGYAEQAGADPTALPAAVASANATDCGSMPNTIAGMGKCMIAMTRKYAPNALVGLHASAWGSNMDVALNTSASLDVGGEAKKVATFLAAAGESDADLVIVETSDRDAGYYQANGRNTWWDATNATLPNFHQDFAWVKALTEALGKPALYWQTPLGNASQNNTTNHWQDNRVDYFFGHMNELAAAHAIGVAYGAGAGDQTTPETDGNNLVTHTTAYASAGGQSLCP